MAKIIFEGWETGMRKIPFVKLLNEKAGLSLAETERVKNKVVDNKITEIEIADENLAKEVLEESRKLKVKARIKD